MHKLTTEEFIQKAKAVHGDRYDYSKVNYINNSTKIILICSTHGEFEQKPNNHLHGKGCKDCAGNRLNTIETFKIKAYKVHKDTYDYTQAVYNGINVKIEIVCKDHGTFFQSPKNHLKGQKCPQCSLITRANKRIVPFKEFVDRSNALQGPIFKYFESYYVSAKTLTMIECLQCGHTFMKMPSQHMFTKVENCPACSTRGFNKSKPAYLYYLKVTTNDNQVLYKIGITNRTVDERFNLTDLSKIEIIKQKLYENGFEALEWETKLKSLYKQYQYKGPDVLSSGNTELFTEDIIAMYYAENNINLETS